jgi:outer membrane receptor for ferric coprogen and ferric-rhodotorulic acid
MIRPPPSALRPVALACLLAAAALPPGAMAQPQAQQAERSYAIAPGPLAPALSAFAGQARVSLSFTPAQTNGLRTPGLQGSHGVAQGFARLLDGTGLRAVAREGGGYTLQAAPRPAAEHTLNAVTVTANQLGEITEGTGSYAPGTIATATRLVLTPRETPQSISVVTRQEMDDFNLTSIDKVMGLTPGVSIVTNDSERIEF